MQKRLLLNLLAVSAVAVTFAPLAHAQSGGKTIRLVVPYAAGGPIDVTARLLAERVKDSLGTVIISFPLGFKTRWISLKAASISGICSKTQLLMTVLKERSGNGISVALQQSAFL